ncbi:MAG: hypothetical protein IJX76_05310 [Clostridia bacterium]|nr:hypothetical protein [Clostridia bacterium]
MTRMTKRLAILLAGLLMSSALASCDAAEEVQDALDDLKDLQNALTTTVRDNENAPSDENGEDAEDNGDPAYRDLTPAEFVNALNTATDLKITVTMVSGSNSQVTKTLIRDGNIACDAAGDRVTTYYDMENSVNYYLNGSIWTSASVDALGKWDYILSLCTNFAPYCFVAENYEAQKDGIYPVKAEAIQEHHGEGAASVATYSAFLKVKGSTYTVESTYGVGDSALTYVIVVQFADQALTLPNMEE